MRSGYDGRDECTRRDSFQGNGILGVGEKMYRTVFDRTFLLIIDLLFVAITLYKLLLLALSYIIYC